MNELALFAGAGGGILGGKLLGWRTVCAVECEPYPASVLCARQNDKILAPFPIWDDVRTFDGNPWRGIVDVVSGGFPCQDISAAGHGAGISGSRSGLWSEMARIIGEVRPRYAFVENSPMLTSRGLGTVLGDLAAMGFDARWGVVSAADVGAPHLRERIWIVGYSDNNGQTATEIRGGIASGSNNSEVGAQQTSKLARSSEQYEAMAHSNSDSQSTGAINAEQVCESDIPNTDNGRRGRREISGEGRNGQSRFYGEDKQMADADSKRLHGGRTFGARGQKLKDDGCGKQMADAKSMRLQGGGAADDTQGREITDGSALLQCGISRNWPSEPNVGRVANGVAARVDRLKAIGNGQVPAVAATAFKLLAGEF